MPPYFQMMARRDASELTCSQFLCALVLICRSRCASAPSIREGGGGQSRRPGPGSWGGPASQLPKTLLAKSPILSIYQTYPFYPIKLTFSKQLTAIWIHGKTLVALKDFLKLFFKKRKQWKGKVETQEGCHNKLYESVLVGCNMLGVRKDCEGEKLVRGL